MNVRRDEKWYCQKEFSELPTYNTGGELFDAWGLLPYNYFEFPVVLEKSFAKGATGSPRAEVNPEFMRGSASTRR